MDKLLTTAFFEVAIPGVAETADELGLWQPLPGETAAESFAVGPAGQAGGREQFSRWRVDLPEDPRLARAALLEQAARLERAEKALPAAARRLRTFVRQSQAQGAESFAVGTAAARRPAQPERELAAWVGAAGEEASFGLIDQLPAGWKEITGQADAFFERVRRSLLYFAWVESASGGRRFGLTIVSWTGHFRTAWGGNLGAAEVEQHIGNLELALRTRANWLRMALLILRGSVQLGVLFPANPLLAVPAAWKFYKQVLELSRELEPRPVS